MFREHKAVSRIIHCDAQVLRFHPLVLVVDMLSYTRVFVDTVILCHLFQVVSVCRGEDLGEDEAGLCSIEAGHFVLKILVELCRFAGNGSQTIHFLRDTRKCFAHGLVQLLELREDGLLLVGCCCSGCRCWCFVVDVQGTGFIGTTTFLQDALDRRIDFQCLVRVILVSLVSEEGDEKCWHMIKQWLHLALDLFPELRHHDVGLHTHMANAPTDLEPHHVICTG
mmetsp:Transcript_7871/g.18383  ORF Transcript_7871/g.18383 Transcript_7871/m.18383 type:complete len:224 (+) Transcript_7871:657-1328(+)